MFNLKKLKENIYSRIWTQRSGLDIFVGDMTYSALKGARAACVLRSKNATTDEEIELWIEWEAIFEEEIFCRDNADTPEFKNDVIVKSSLPANEHEGLVTKRRRPPKIRIDMVCFCGTVYSAKPSDIVRGYAQSCSQACARRRRTALLAESYTVESKTKVSVLQQQMQSANDEKRRLADLASS